MGYRKWWRRALVVAVTALVLLGNLASASASDPLDKVRQANSFYDNGQFENALRLYREAHDELDDPRLLYRIGLSYENLGNYERGRAFLERYLKEDPDSPVKGRVEASIRQLRDLEGAIQAYLLIETEPAGVDIFLHGYMGEPEASSPATIPVGAGSNRVTLVFDGGQRLEVDIEVGAGSTEERFFSIGTAVAPEDMVDDAQASAEMAAAEGVEPDADPSDAADLVDEAVDEARDGVADHDDVIPSPEASPDRDRPIRMDYVNAGPPWWANTLAFIGIAGGQLMLFGTVATHFSGEDAPWGWGLTTWAVGTAGGIYLLGRNWRSGLPDADRRPSASITPSGSIPAASSSFMLRWQTNF